MKLILEIEGERYPLATYAWEQHKQTRNGRCCSSAQDGALTVGIAATDDNGLHLPALAADPFSTFSGHLTAYKETQRQAFRLMQWKRARMIRYKSHFDKYGESLNTYVIQPLDLQMGALRMKLDGRGWRRLAEEPQAAHAAPPLEDEIEKEQKIQCSLYFRRTKAYDGSFGFDWLRTGDTGEAGDHWYRDIMTDIPGMTVLQQYDDLVATQYHSFTEGWKQGHPVYGNDSQYVVPWLTLMPETTARLRLKLDVEENPTGKVELRFGNSRDEQYLSLNFKEVPAGDAGSYYHPRELEVTCLKSFSNDIVLQAMAQDTEVGRLVIAGHKHQKKISVAMVTVTTLNSSSKVVSQKPDRQVEARLRRYLGQAYIVPDFFELALDLTVIPPEKEVEIVHRRRKIRKKVVSVPIDTRGGTKELDAPGKPLIEVYYRNNGINPYHPAGIRHWKSIQNFMNCMLFQQNPALREDLEEAWKLYFFAEEGAGLQGQANDGDKEPEIRAAVIFAGAYDRDTPPHELLHSLGLDHTFIESDSILEKYKFRKAWTDNIMDYEPKNGESDRFSLWYWQIKKLWRYLENHLKS